MDNVLLYSEEPEALLSYFWIILEVLTHHCTTIKLAKCKFLKWFLEFMGIDVHPVGNSLADSNFEAFKKLETPHTWMDL